MRPSYTIKGTNRIYSKLKEMERVCPEGVLIGMYKLAGRVMDDSQGRVPVQSGELQRSAYVARPELRAGRAGVELGYGAEHAVEVHEDTAAYHDDGESKFLEKALFTSAKGNLWRVAKWAEKAIKTGEKWSPGKYPTRPKS